MLTHEGVCPACNARGVVGHRCEHDRCARAGIHLVPERYLARAPLRDKRLGHLFGSYMIVERRKHYDAPVAYRVLQLPALLEGELVLVDAGRAPETHKNLLRQAMALARIWHPHVVRLVTFGEDQHGTWVVTDLHGDPPTLADLLGGGFTGLEPAAVLALVDPLAAALEAVADAHLVHGVIRPEHIQIYDVPGASGHPVLSGFVRVPVEDGDAPAPSTRELVYQAPELVGTHTIGATTDAYALATVTFELLTGRVPFEPSFKKTDRGPDLLGSATSSWPDTTLTFFKKALAWAPSRRYPSASTFRAALGEALAALVPAPASAAPEDAVSTAHTQPMDVEVIRAEVHRSRSAPQLPAVAPEPEAPTDDDALDPWHWSEKNKLAAKPPPATGDEDNDASASAAHKSSGTVVMSADDLEAAARRARAVPRMHTPAGRGH